jgi:hypothetical protein
MTGLTDPMDDFYDRHPELADLDRALDTCHRAHQKMLEDLADAGDSRQLDGEDEQSVYEVGLEPGHVYMLVEDAGRSRLVELAVVDRYVFDPDAEQSR